jgi:hypothetical protein
VRLSDFNTQIQSVRSNAHEYEVQIAQVDPTPGDDIDVQLSEVGWVELDYEAGQARLYPRSAVTETTPDKAIPTLEELQQLLPVDDTGDGNLLVLVELPLDRDGPGLIRTSLEAIQYVHIGSKSREVWLLVGPKDSFGSVLPA